MDDTEKQFKRIDMARLVLDKVIMGLEDTEERKEAFIHLYGVGQACAMIALKRGHDGKYAELAYIAGLFHDIAKYENGIEGPEHGKRGALRTWKLLAATEEFSEEELTAICTGIANHSEKTRTDDDFSEIIKDGDAMQHWLHDPAEALENTKTRNVALMKELGIR